MDAIEPGTFHEARRCRSGADGGARKKQPVLTLFPLCRTRVQIDRFISSCLPEEKVSETKISGAESKKRGAESKKCGAESKKCMKEMGTLVGGAADSDEGDVEMQEEEE